MKNGNIKLIPYDEKYIDYLYEHIINEIVAGFESVKLKEKKDLDNFLNNSNVFIKMFAINKENNNIVGYIAGYNYNKIDAYIYFTTILGMNREENNEILNLFINYMFSYFPIRKIYCEAYEKDEKKIDILKDYGFIVEANLKEDTFFDGKYYDKYILTLYREGYSNG